MKTQQKIQIMPNLGKGIVYNFLIALLALVLTWLFKRPNIDIESNTAITTSIILFILFLGLIGWSAISARRGGEKYSPFKHVRHPIYAGIVFLLNPALAIYFRSWLYLAACFLIYFIWRNLAKSEELGLARVLGSDYNQYRLKTSLLFPNLFAINKPFAFIMSGALIFILAFVALNFSSLSFRYVDWGKDQQLIKSDKAANTEVGLPYGSPTSVNSINSAPVPQALPQAQDIKYDKPNSIVIEKLGIDAPLALSQGQTQKELNADLDKGVIIYPGSAMPGEIGNFFATGHSSVYFWNKTPYGRIFATLDKLEPGDGVVVYYDQHKYEYEITKKLVLSPKDVHLFGTNERIITLMTCWPIGTSLKRLVAEGKLVK